MGGDVGRWGPCGLAHTRAMRGAHAGDAWRGAGYGLVHPRVLTAWEGRLCVGRARGVLPCSRALSRSTGPFASKGVPGLSRRGGKTRGARGWRRQRRRGGGPRRRGRGDGGGARVWTATTRAVRRSARVGRRRGGGEGGGARGGYRWRWAAVEKRAVTEKAAADIEWNGGTACKEKGLSPLPPF